MERLISRFKHDIKGSLAMLFALSSIPTLGMIGVALDYSRMSDVRATLQAAADSAALSAVVLPAGDRDARATSVVEAYTKSLTGLSISKYFNVPSAGKYEVVVYTSVTGTISKILGGVSKQVSAKATAYIAVSTPPAQSGNVCFFMKTISGEGALRINSNVNIDMGNCQAHVQSNHSQAFILNANSMFKTSRVCVKGQARNNGGSVGGGTIAENCTTAIDNVGGTLPAVNFDASKCQFRLIDKNGMSVPTDQTVTIAGQSVALGCHQGLNINGGVSEVTFAPGVHVVQGDLNLMGKVNAIGVTFYFQNGNAGMQMNGNPEFYASAPKTGPTSGILFFQAPALPNKVLVFNATGGQTLEGLVYLPSYDIHFRSKVKAGTKDKVSWVSNTFIADSNTKWDIDAAVKTVTTTTSPVQTASKPPILVK
jgi:hypothetical protein